MHDEREATTLIQGMRAAGKREEEEQSPRLGASLDR